MARVVIIDADPNLVNLLKILLAEAGHESTAYPEAAGVVDALALQPPDLVILDPWLQRPGEGWDVVTGLQAESRTCAVPIIVYSSGTDDLQRRAQWLKSQGVRVLYKPFNLSDLEDLVSDALAS